VGLEGAKKVSAVVDGEYTLLYPGVLPGVDLRYTVTSVGFKEEAIILDNKAQRELTFEISSPALTMQVVPESKRVLVKDASGVAVFEPNRPVMWDAKGIHSDDISVQVLAGKQQGDWLVKYTPSDSYMDDPRITYPVVVDPSICIVGQHPQMQETGRPETPSESCRLGTNPGATVKERSTTGSSPAC